MFDRAKRFLSNNIVELAFFITAAALAYVGFRIFHYWEIYKHLEPNSWGDFFAGIFSPLAFMWLIVGYFLQAAELKASVAAQNENAQAALALLEHERRKSEALQKKENTAQLVFGSVGMEPVLTYSITGETIGIEYLLVEFQIANLGEAAFNYEVDTIVSEESSNYYHTSVYETTDLSGKSDLIWLKHQVNCVEFKFHNYEFPIKITCKVTYTNKDQSEDNICYDIFIPDDITVQTKVS